MAIAKTLDILLRAPTGKLDKDFKSAQQMAAKFFGNINALAATAFGGFSIAAFVGRINTAFNTLDETSKRALKLNLDVSQVRGLELAADLSGLALDKLTTSYARLSKAIDGAVNGEAKQVELFKKLGIEAEALSQLSLDQQFQQVAVAFDSIKDNTARAAAAIELFGKSGLELLPLLANGGMGIVDAMRDAQRLGGFISNQEAQSIEASNDAFTRLQFTLNSVFQKIAIDMAPALQRLWENLTEAIKPGTALNGLIKAMGDLLTFTVVVLNEMVGLTSFLSQSFGTLTGRFLAGFIITVALTKAYAALAALLSILRIRTIALAAVEAARVAIQKKNLVASLAVAGVGVAVFAAFSDQINALVDGLLGVADAQGKVNDEVGQFAKLQSGVSSKPVNLSSASFGSQAALEQLLTVRSERQGIAQVVNEQQTTNEILSKIEAGLRGANGIVGDNFEIVEEDL